MPYLQACQVHGGVWLHLWRGKFSRKKPAKQRIIMIGRDRGTDSGFVIQEEKLNKVLHVLQRAMLNCSTASLLIDLVLLYLLTNVLSSPKVAHVLQQSCQTEGEVRFHATLPETLFMLPAHALNQCFEHLIGLRVLCEAFKFLQTQIPRAVFINLIE
jgi:hypothetical protein